MLDVSLVVMLCACNTPLSYGWVGWGNSPTLDLDSRNLVVQ